MSIYNVRAKDGISRSSSGGSMSRLAVGVSVVLLLMGSAPAQEKKPGAAPIQQDRATIPAVLDSWYVVTQGGQNVGHVHEVLERQTVGVTWSYNYTVDVEIEMMVADPKDPGKEIPYVEAQRVVAKLDDTYGPVNLQRTDHRDGIDVVSSVFSEETNKRIDIVLGQEAVDRRSYPVGPDEEVHYSRSLMFIFLRQNGFLSKPGTRRALLFVPRNDNNPPMVEVQIDVQDMVKREYVGKEVSVTRIVYVKPPPEANRDAELSEAFVDKYGRVVEETTRGGLRRMLVAGEADAVGQGMRIRQQARRDPFHKPVTSGLGDKGKEKEKEVKIDDVQAGLKEMDRLVEQIRKAKEEGRRADGEKYYDEFLRYCTAIKKAGQTKPMQPADLARIEAARNQVEQIWGGLASLMKRLRGIYVTAFKHFQVEECSEMEKGISDLKKGMEERAIQDTQEQLEVGVLIGELELLVTKCKTRQELGRKKLVVTGTLLHDHVEMVALDPSVVAFGHIVGSPFEVKFLKPNRMVVINEKLYRTGDVVEGEGVRVEKIWAHGVQVSLRDEIRDVPLR